MSYTLLRISPYRLIMHTQHCCPWGALSGRSQGEPTSCARSRLLVKHFIELRQFDVLALEPQANETEQRTKYLEWRRDILDAVSPARFDAWRRSSLRIIATRFTSSSGAKTSNASRLNNRWIFAFYNPYARMFK